MLDPRWRAILLRADELQQERARLFLMLDMLTDLCDAQGFCEVLADVATLHAEHSPLTARDRERWQRLAETAQACAVPAGELRLLRKPA